jgi:hypothetical protein
VLWPEPTRNVSALLCKHGHVYDEEAFLKSIPRSGTDKTPDDTRTVRNTAEVLALAGLAFRTGGDPDRFLLTRPGLLCAQFLGVGGPAPLANDANIALLGRHMAFGLACVAEYRAIWEIMLRCHQRLSNEELNRALTSLGNSDDIEPTALKVMESRKQNDPKLIGPRLYKEDQYADPSTRSDQRKAMNPWFLLAGAGGILIATDDEYRMIRPWAAKFLESALRATDEVLSLSSETITHKIEARSCAPISYLDADDYE